MTVAMVAASITAGPASAGSPGEHTLSAATERGSVEATVCTAVQAGVSGATGSCQDPAPHLSFRVTGECLHAVTGQRYSVASQLVPTSQTASVFCGRSAFVDRILSWDTQIVQTAPGPPNRSSTRWTANPSTTPSCPAPCRRATGPMG